MVDVELGPVHIDLRAAPRPDGYRPITAMLWVWPTFAGAPSHDAWRFVLSAARRLDVAHRQLERLREAVDRTASMLQGATGTSPASREALFEAIGEAELFMVGLYRALRMAADVGSKFEVSSPPPKTLIESLIDVKEIRDAFEHIDERALSLRHKKPDGAALTVFEFQGFLFKERILRYHQWSLGIDDQATELTISARDHIVKAWTELCGKPKE